MKKLTKFATISLCSILLFSSCGPKNIMKSNGNETKPLENNAIISGQISTNTTLYKNNTYFLKGGVHVKPGATLTIEPGVIIRSDPNEASTAYLLIEPGAKIMAEGTEANPIVLTSGKTVPKEQDWGGLIICGNAPINVAGGKTQSEMGSGVTYGGNDENDNSGIIRYVRVEYSGKVQTPTKEHNGFTFEGVGAGTQVDHISAYRCGDDGIEFFGGSVQIKYVTVYGAQDDTFDWTYGWHGKAQFLLGIQKQGGVADRGIEADNNSNDNTANPFSNPTLSNVTLIGANDAKTGDDPTTATATGKTIALKLREGTKANIHNMVVFGFNNGINIQHDQTLKNVSDGSLILANNVFSNPNAWAFIKTGTIEKDKGENVTASFNNPYTASNSTDITFIKNGYIGVQTTGAIDPKSIDSWFESANFIGAVSAENNWVNKGTWARVSE